MARFDNPRRFDHLGDAKYKNRAYIASVRAWVRRLRHWDLKTEHENQFRNRTKNNLATGGKSGLSPGVPEPLWDAVVVTDDRDVP